MLKSMSRAMLLSSAFISTSATSQSVEFPLEDDFGVDLVNIGLWITFEDGSIGNLPLTRRAAHGSPYDWDVIRLRETNTGFQVVKGHRVFENFVRLQGGGFAAVNQDGAQLSGSNGSYIYINRDGLRISFSLNSVASSSHKSSLLISSHTNVCGVGISDGQCVLVPTSITSPSGERLDLAWNVYTYTYPGATRDYRRSQALFRLSSVNNSSGYGAEFVYPTEGTSSSGGATPLWFQKREAILRSGGIEQQRITFTYPDSSSVEITQPSGVIWRYTTDSLKNLTAESTLVSSQQVSTSERRITRNGVTRSYNRTSSSSTVTVTVTDSLNNVMTVNSSVATGRPASITDWAGQTTTYAYDAGRRVRQVTRPEGDSSEYTLDDRGNILQARSRGKPGSGAADIVSSAVFPVTCQFVASCNKPSSTTDAGGNVTDFSYDANHGGVLTVTLPSPTVGGVRAQERYGYQVVSGVTLPSSVSFCRTTSTCAGTEDETLVSLSYDARHNLVSHTAGSGTGSLIATTSFGYDAVGNRIMVDGPLAGAADTARIRYDAARRLVGVVGPDPDGGGPARHRARRTVYDAAGRITAQEVGSVADQSDAAWASFSPTLRATTDYDVNSRPVTQRRIGSDGGTHAISQASYDALGRLECTAVRMNSATWGSLPGACTQTAVGGLGADRISRTHYDALSRVVRQESGVGTTDVGDDVVRTYTPNGQVASLADGNGNVTSYGYDGHDRLKRTSFPGGSYEELGYDPQGRGLVTSQRLRDGHVINFGYDNLGRLTSVDRPGISAFDRDMNYAYNNLGRVISATDVVDRVVTRSYDALGRMISEQGYGGYLTFEYNAAGQRTRSIWADNFNVTYGYNAAGDLTTIREGDHGLVLGTYGYDDLGRRTSLVRGNGTVTSWSYDALSQLNGLGHDLAGTAQDVSLGFGYNPAAQIVSSTRSNDAYAWTGHYNVDRSYSVNGLNQYTQTGPVTPTYDGRGNVTSAGSQGYAYNSFNQLDNSSNGGTFNRDPLGRLDYLSAENAAWGYDGDALIVEYTGGQIARRYVHGPGVDEPLVWYEGAGTADRRWLHQDERGSVIAVTNGSGQALAINTYDEYGIPGANNQGRFQYTGQRWMPSLGMYDYKARTYSPTLGRFMQTDPIGYGDGMNMYAYVGGDPVNRTDPSGMEDCILSITSVLRDGILTELGRSVRCYGGSAGGGVTGNIGALLGGSGGSGGAGGGGRGGGARPSRAATNEAPQRTQALSPCQLNFLAGQLSGRGLPSSHLGDVRFVSGLDASAGAFTRNAFNGGASAVTQGNTIYVQPTRFDDIANFRSATGYEEIVHTAQFAGAGGAAFYQSYGLNSIMAKIAGLNGYNGNAYEAFAKGASNVMFNNAQSSGCPR